MTKVGGYYALQADGAYAAAGLLSAAHQIHLRELGPNEESTVQTALLLAPVYERIDRLGDAESLYEQVFQAQERAKGSNNPELSLYIRLLAGIYEKQGRLTEAEALNRHMRQIFRDAFGARRYAANRSRDRLFAINRPVSLSFPLEAEYIPPDLVRASAYEVPMSKPSHVEEMQMRLAEVDGSTMPKSLAGLLEACSTPDERLSLRSAYRSHRTQQLLHRINGDKGTVAHPGTSEHQLGLAADIDVNRRFMRATDKAYACFERTAWQHGFILSFPQGNTYLPGADSFEPWHWRFVGERTALLYREIGPWGRPQEFLAALPCYEERALSGLFVDRERGDVCFESLAMGSGKEGTDS
nr:D-alanyl-D-alanine carboxypeptidase family protein [Parvularcula maris]